MSKSIFSAPRFTDETAAYAYVESVVWADGRVCPHCGVVERSAPLRGKSSRVGLYKCYACRKTFTVKVGTIFEDSHIALRDWLTAMHLVGSSKNGISANQLHRTLGITLKSAWYMAHRIRLAMNPEVTGNGSTALGGANQVVEADETYVGGKAKNRKNHVPPKAAVFALVERDGRVRSQHVPEVSAKTLKPILAAHLDKRTYLMTDESTVYPGIAKDTAAGHGTVNHSAEEYVKDGGFTHTNTVEGYFSILKRGINGVYHHVSQQHLHRYLSEFDLRYNERTALGITDTERAEKIVQGVVGKRLTYRTTGGGRATESPEA